MKESKQTIEAQKNCETGADCVHHTAKQRSDSAGYMSHGINQRAKHRDIMRKREEDYRLFKV